jgi:hypothetical protein
MNTCIYKDCVAINTYKDYDNKNIYKDCVAINIYIYKDYVYIFILS